MAKDDLSAALVQEVYPFVENLYHCLRCNYCVEMSWQERGIQHVCPTLLHHNPAPGYSGKGYLATARALLEGEELPIDSLVERFFNCTTCGNCEEVCPVGLRPAHLVRQVRAAMAAQGLAPAPIAACAANVIEHHNPTGAPNEARNAWAVGLAGVAADAETLYLPGCAASCDAPDEARATVSVLHQAGLPLKLLPADQSPCCGAPLGEIGYPAQADAERLQLAAAIERSGCRRIAVSGAECVASLAGVEVAGGVEVLHAFDLIERAIAESRIDFKPSADVPRGPIAVLDSCHLSKPSHSVAGAADYPRRIRGLLERLGCRTADAPDQGSYAICCGAAGGMPYMSPLSAARMAEGKLRSFAEVGAVAVITASPLCVAHLRRSRIRSLPEAMGIFQFIETYFRLRPIAR